MTLDNKYINLMGYNRYLIYFLYILISVFHLFCTGYYITIFEV